MGVNALVVGEGGERSEPGEGCLAPNSVFKKPLTRRLTSFGATLSHKGRG
jgi:hypothetical protein